ncbi:hypothetical protein BC938DRAFT_483109 [Jimgerdemannia flammicorona]|uniref:Uncharacterized protein n=1 Tax=Jimgerdemannia flammicorona TaxID=994334 RepID=A0A433QCS0_9FUNG|nr:hypothetical protein BC938DRAFT_483109 [Jimgerdemannia flammicorona]
MLIHLALIVTSGRSGSPPSPRCSSSTRGGLSTLTGYRKRSGFAYCLACRLRLLPSPGVPINVPLGDIDLEKYLGHGQQPDEELLPEDAATRECRFVVIEFMSFGDYGLVQNMD